MKSSSTITRPSAQAFVLCVLVIAALAWVQPVPVLAYCMSDDPPLVFGPFDCAATRTTRAPFFRV